MSNCKGEIVTEDLSSPSTWNLGGVVISKPCMGCMVMIAIVSFREDGKG